MLEGDSLNKFSVGDVPVRADMQINEDKAISLGWLLCPVTPKIVV